MVISGVSSAAAMLRPERSHGAVRQTRVEEKRSYVVISEQAKKLSEDLRMARKAESYLRSQPDVRQDRVDELKSRVESGAYSVPSSAVADKLLSRISII
jgi:flagellar biosynthesis anti-sigma factor FlgM